MSAIVPFINSIIQLVCLTDAVDSLWNLPEVVGRDVMSGAAKLALKADARWVEGAGPTVMPRSTALRARVMVVVAKVASAVIVPSTGSIH